MRDLLQSFILPSDEVVKIIILIAKIFKLVATFLRFFNIYLLPMSLMITLKFLMLIFKNWKCKIIILEPKFSQSSLYTMNVTWKVFCYNTIQYCLIINKHHADQIDFLGGDTKNKQETRSPKRFRDESVVLQKKIKK